MLKEWLNFQVDSYKRISNVYQTNLFFHLCRYFELSEIELSTLHSLNIDPSNLLFSSWLIDSVIIKILTMWLSITDGNKHDAMWRWAKPMFTWEKTS